MDKFLVSIISFIVVFIIIFLYQFLYVINKSRKNNYKKVSVEANYIITKFHLDIKKINFDDLLKKSSIVAAFDISFVYAFITYFIDNI